MNEYVRFVPVEFPEDFLVRSIPEYMFMMKVLKKVTKHCIEEEPDTLTWAVYEVDPDARPLS